MTINLIVILLVIAALIIGGTVFIGIFVDKKQQRDRRFFLQARHDRCKELFHTIYTELHVEQLYDNLTEEQVFETYYDIEWDSELWDGTTSEDWAARVREVLVEELWLGGFNEMTVREFFELRQSKPEEFTGVYILHNTTDDMYYVGQATKIIFRVNQHFTGKGNGDVYADWKYGSDFTIKLISLAESGYKSLDKLEKDMIEKFDANITGYNKTCGNGD